MNSIDLLQKSDNTSQAGTQIDMHRRPDFAGRHGTLELFACKRVPRGFDFAGRRGTLELFACKRIPRGSILLAGAIL